VRLQLQTRPRRIDFQQRIHRKRRFGLVVEGLDLRPFQARHVQRQRPVRRCPLGLGLQKFGGKLRPRFRKLKEAEGCRVK